MRTLGLLVLLSLSSVACAEDPTEGDLGLCPTDPDPCLAHEAGVDCVHLWIQSNLELGECVHMACDSGPVHMCSAVAP